MSHDSISLRVQAIEFRWSPDNRKYELVQWFEGAAAKPYCIVVAFFEYSKEGFDLRTVGRRYQNALDQLDAAVRIVTGYAFDALEARHRAETRTKELKLWQP